MSCPGSGPSSAAGEQFVLLQQFFLLGDHTADFGPQFGEGFLEQVDGLLGSGLFAFIVLTQALQQGFRAGGRGARHTAHTGQGRCIWSQETR